MNAPDCPGCDSSGANRQRIAHDWWFCAVCGARFLLDDTGEVVKWITGNGKRGADSPRSQVGAADRDRE